MRVAPGRTMATKCLDDLDVGQTDSAIELFYANSKKVFENESDSDSETEETTLEQTPSSELSNDLIELEDSFEKAQLDGKPRHKGKNPLRRAYSLQSDQLAIDPNYKPIIRIKPGLRSKPSTAQLEELKGIGMQDSLILRSLSVPCQGELEECLSDGRKTVGETTRTMHQDTSPDAERRESLPNRQLSFHNPDLHLQISGNIGNQEKELTRRGGQTHLHTI